MLFLHNDFKESEIALQKILDYYPQHLPSILLLAQIAWDQDHYQKSREYYNKALHFYPASKEARLWRAKSSYNLYRFEDALDDYLTLYEHSFKSIEYLLALGDVYQKLNLQIIALRYYQKALKQGKKKVQVYIALAYQHIIMWSYKLAAEHITQAKELYYENKASYPQSLLEDIQQWEKTLHQLLWDWHK